jgi:hypothetical protein
MQDRLRNPTVFQPTVSTTSTNVGFARALLTHLSLVVEVKEAQNCNRSDPEDPWARRRLLGEHFTNQS